MRDFKILQNLIGETVTEQDLQYVDCYVQHKLGIFIPFGDGCGYAARAQHFMEQHYAEEITVGRLAALGNISVSAFNRIFKKDLGVDHLLTVFCLKNGKATTWTMDSNFDEKVWVDL